MLSCKKKIKKIDALGYPINLNFEKGDYFTTFSGGLLTILMYSSLVAIFFIEVLKVGQHDNDITV
jgi:hypothetical protein